MRTKIKQKNSGFTLIELMVATSIFVIVMLSSMSALFILLGAGKNSKALQSAMDNVNFAIESMTRSIRMGTNYYCGSFSASDLTSTSNCGSGDYLISFVPQSQNGVPATSRVGYQNVAGVLKRYDSANTNGVPIVSPNVFIEELKFFVNGSNPSDSKQASVYVVMKGTVTTQNGPVSFSLQTLASQRNF